MDVYYQKMIKADPGNPLLLGNYAKFLKEVCSSLNTLSSFFCPIPELSELGREQYWD